MGNVFSFSFLSASSHEYYLKVYKWNVFLKEVLNHVCIYKNVYIFIHSHTPAEKKNRKGRKSESRKSDRLKLYIKVA